VIHTGRGCITVIDLDVLEQVAVGDLALP